MARDLRALGGYRVLAVLGEGGMGTVYRALDSSGREVALKVVRDELSRDDAVRRRFRREVEVARSIVHPNVVRTLDGGESEGRLFLVSELVRGGSLEDLLGREGRLDEPRALRVFRDLVAALDALFRAGTVHRDVKPANLLLESTGLVKLGDLGLARSTDARRERFTATGELLGTPAYAAPEQIEGERDLDIRADLYSAGCVLFECLAGARPYLGATLVELLKGHLRSPIPDVRARVPAVSPRVAELVTELLAKERAGRPATPALVLARLDALSGSAPVASPPAAFPGTLDDAAPVAPFPATLDDTGGGAAPFPGTLEEAPAAPADLVELWPGAAVGVVPGPSVVATQRGEGAPAALRGGGGLTRAALVFSLHDGTTPDASRTLFLYAGRRLVLGRDGLERAGQDVCLRLRPAAGREALIRRISGQHLALEVGPDGASVEDLGSAGGTTLDGVRLVAGARTPVRAPATVRVSDVLDLRLVPVGFHRGAPSGRPESGGALLVLRPGDGHEHAYALVSERLVLGVPSEPGRTIEIETVAGGLRADGRALDAGVELSLAAAHFLVREVRPADQK